MQEKAIAVIRHSLAAANAALDMLSVEAAPVVETTVEAAPVVETTVETAPVVDTSSDDFIRLYDELADSDFDLRTVAELTSRLGMNVERMKQLLRDNDVNFVTLNRRSDSAPLIGLASRN